MQKTASLFLFPLLLLMIAACSLKNRHAPDTDRTIGKRIANPIQRVCFRPNSVPLESRLQKLGLKAGIPLYIRIFKQERTLELWGKKGDRFALLKSYPICRYSGYLGPKRKSGDKQAPEGVYALTKKSLHPNSHYHLALDINYPNRYDRNHHRDGNLIMIHGKCSSVGCFAMGNTQIEEIYKMVESALKKGTKFIYVAIYPFRMTDRNLQSHIQSYWYPFWRNLKTGYDMFEATHVPPFVGVRGAEYVFQQRGSDLTQN